MNDCVFCAIRDRKIPSNILYEDNHVMVFPDIHPVKPVHIIIISKKHIADFMELADDVIYVALKKAIARMVGKTGLKTKGYKIVVNGGGAQIIDHLHVHLLGPMGRKAPL